ncbi:MAG: NADH-quinone oxidoreductase subunit NuoK [Desulfovibrionaceae bacterium]|jgi:NADH-quinone oxidoreductase subunit K
MNVPLSHVVALGAVLFAIGAVCAVARRSVLMILIGLEFMLAAGGIVFAGAALAWGNPDGQAAIIIVLGLAAAEAALGLALVVHGRRGGGSIAADDYDRLRG